MCVPDDSKLEVLATHYSETSSMLIDVKKRRDRLFLYLLLVLFILLVFILAPFPFADLLNRLIENWASGDRGDPIFNVAIIGSFLWFSILCLTHTYFQTVLHVERQAVYVKDLEDTINKDFFSGTVFTRDGKHYQNNKGHFSNWTKMIFWWAFPAVLIIVMCYWSVSLFWTNREIWIYLFVNVSISLAILVSTILFIIDRQKITKNDDDKKQNQSKDD